MNKKEKEKNALLLTMGTRVRRLRLEANLTVKDFAERADLSPRFINQLEAGSGNISVAGLARVGTALNRTLAELLTPPDADHSLRAEVWRMLNACDDGDWHALHQWLAKRKGRSATPRYIALVGILGAGKSTLGPMLAEALSTEFVEVDQVIEESAGMSLSDLFSIHGETYYRTLERESLAKLFSLSRGCIFAPGGSVVTDAESWNLVKQRCFTVWLHAAPDELMKRTARKGNPRLLKRPSVLTDLKNLLMRREPFYAESQLVIHTSGKMPKKILTEILQALPS